MSVDLSKQVDSTCPVCEKGFHQTFGWLVKQSEVICPHCDSSYNLGGTFVFALSGGVAGVKHRLDIFGVLVLSFAAASAGGIARDVMIAATPVAALSDWRYVAVSLLAGLLTFYCY